MSEKVEKKLEQIEMLLQQSVALQMYVNGCPKDEIGRHLHVAKSSVIKMLKGVKIKQNGKE